MAGAELEDLTSLPRSIEGVEVGLTLRQQKDGSFKISVRTGHDTNACNIARRLGGGGHPRAAGCEISGNPDNAKHAILEEVKRNWTAPTRRKRNKAFPIGEGGRAKQGRMRGEPARNNS
ncbi:DHHA1 domain-containing protein [Gemmiger formicilis]|nr:DHHA1 domain-containing protein [Gemmiger formicilis]